MRFLADENFPLDSSRYLENAGYDIDIVVRQFPPISDATILDRAVNSQRVVLTFDTDFGTLIYRDRMTPPPGILLFRLLAFAPLEPAMIILRLIADDYDLIGKFTTVEPNELRQRPFPPTST